MGWKTLKERFNIDYTVQITKDSVWIGPPMVPNMLVIDRSTGRIPEDLAFSDVALEQVPGLKNASPEDILDALRAEDEFDSSVRVYTWEGGEILEKFCEELDFPNVTHDGCQMHSNTFSTDRDQVVQWAKQDAKARLDSEREAVAKLTSMRNKHQSRLEHALADCKKLEQA